MDREKGFSHALFQSCRIIFEHLFSMQRLPQAASKEFNIKWINDYIEEHKEFVYTFYSKIVEVKVTRKRNRKESRLGI
jgi:hypothetical protein